MSEAIARGKEEMAPSPNVADRLEVERFRPATRVLHWVHSAAFLALVITGFFLFVPAFSGLAVGGVSRFLHRIAVVVFIAAPLIYFIKSPGNSWTFIKEAFTWGKDDLGWIRAAPAYYFMLPGADMPPQGHINTGQKLYWLITILCSVIITISGALMWGLKDIMAPAAYQWSVVAHDVAFIAIFCMFLVHFQLSVLHPRMPESLRSMIFGKASVTYVKSHHGKWYEKISRSQAKAEAKPRQNTSQS